MGVSIAALLGAGAISAASGLGNTALSYLGQDKLNYKQYEYDINKMQNEQIFNSAEAAKQRSFEQWMSDTAYQRAVADMEAAGLNPASMAGSSPASTPSTASASSQIANGHMSNFHAVGSMDSIMSSAVNGMIAKDRDAAKYLADELRDNARHAHKMEEIAEWKAEKKAENSSWKDLGFDEL